MDAENNQENANTKLKTKNIRDANHAIPVRSVLVFLLATLATAILVDLLPTKCSYWNWQRQQQDVNKDVAATKPTYAIYGRSKTEEHLIHVINVLDRLGYKRVNMEDNWDLLWAHDYPFIKMPQRMKSLDKYQMVNHFPGCGFITNKVDLSTTPLPFLPRAFRLPSQREEFLEYVEHNPTALFVEKHNEHRHIAIRAPEEINLNSNDSFVQEFLQNPFLVDGYKFDIGVYVVITSIDPLRLYIYTGDVLFRYCPVKYHPFNASNVDKYVVGDDYLPTWQVPSLVKYYKRLGGSMRGAFDAYVRDQKQNPLGIWLQVEDIIRRTVLAKEQDIKGILRAYKTKNFFDLMRFDLIIDENLKVHLMEANMSPNLSSAHFKPNSLLYEQILYSVMNLMGIGSPLHNKTQHDRTEEVKEMLTSERNLATNINDCAEHGCDKSCNRQECDLCLPCLSGSEYDILEKAHHEHLHRISMKRIFPKPILQPENFDIATEVQNMTKRNAWMTRWFYYKCLYDSSWCI
ncbi:probable tubulin polyglutamylase ttll-15 [Calliphora vicina]|uniref:probable tubulin polyglutamylase ttll-15 n=1 Tax=Calliphora vicina TaxID=7373 RepID=UPI00325B6AB8